MGLQASMQTLKFISSVSELITNTDMLVRMKNSESQVATRNTARFYSRIAIFYYCHEISFMQADLFVFNGLKMDEL
jgi:hypothetical protein